MGEAQTTGSEEVRGCRQKAYRRASDSLIRVFPHMVYERRN